METEPDGDLDGGDDEDGDSGDDDGAERKPRKRPGSSKRIKTEQLEVHETIKVAPTVPIPEGSRFKGYRNFIVQDVRIQAHNTCYRRERYVDAKRAGSDDVVIPAGTFLDEQWVEQLEGLGVDEMLVRSVITCENKV